MARLYSKFWVLLIATFFVSTTTAVFAQAVQMTTSGSYTQNFNTLIATGSATWADNSTIPNWYAQRSGTGNTIVANSGTDNTGALYSYGAISSTERALGSVGSGTPNDFAWGILLQNTSARTINEIRVTYTMEQWRNSVAVGQSLDFFYRISGTSFSNLNPGSNTGWTPISELSATSPITEVAQGPLDGNLATNQVVFTNILIPNLSLAPNEFIMLRWRDVDHSGDDHGLSIDDVTISWVVPTSNITISSISSASFNLANCSATAAATVNFAATGGINAGNTYSIQLSDATGSFVNPITVGSIATSALNLTNVPVTIPAGTLTGSNYRMRVISSNSLITGDVSTFTININQSGTCASASNHHFRSRQTGSWNNPSTWESSPDGATQWIIATLSPTSAANNITIRNGHNVTITADMSADQLTIEAGGILTHNHNINFSLENGPGDDMVISGTYVIFGSHPSGIGNYVVQSGGRIRADGNGGGLADDIARSTNGRVIFRTGSIFEWNNSLSFNTGNITYFPNNAERPIFLISRPLGTLGGDNPTVINGLLELNGNLTLGGAGTKTFRDGMIGTATLTQAANSGVFIINGTNAVLGGTGAIVLYNAGMQITNGAAVSLISNKTINATSGIGTFIVNNGGRLDCNNLVISGSSLFTVATGGSLGIGSAQGISASGTTGNIQVTGTRTFNHGGIYIYNGATNQITGNGLPNPVTTVLIANTGATGNNQVTLTTNNTTATNLELNSGLFASGLNQNLNIAAGGNVNGNGGRNPNDPVAGTITFLANGSTQGNQPGRPELYSVIINGGVDFNGATPNNNATILNTLQINAGGFIVGIDAPIYLANSNLIYNTGGPYGRGAEWGNTAGLPGYPHHVTVQNGTNLNLAAGTPTALETGGDLRIGVSTSQGFVSMGNLTTDLVVRGDLTIGGTAPSTNGSILTLSTAFGSDLFLHGNFTRHNGSFFTDNNRATFFTGSSNATISTPGVTPGTGANSATQVFSFLIIDKASPSATVTLTLNAPVAVSAQNNALNLTSGQVATTLTNLLILPAGATYAGGTNDNSYVTGPMRKIGNTAFRFPVGKPEFFGPAAQGLPTVGGFRPIDISAPGNVNDAYTAEFFVANANLLGPIVAPAAPTVVRVSGCEYWSLDRFTGSSNTALNVTIRWESRSKCNFGSYVSNPAGIVIARSTGAPLASNSGVWNEYGGNGTGNNNTGTVTWNNFNFFNTGRTPLALASINQNDNLLPFRFTSFTATGRGKQAQLDWSVNINANIVSYTIERSSDGRNFSPVFSVNSTVEAGAATYRQFDATAPAGWNYYRLRATDHQQESHFSATQKVWLGSGSAFQMGPNPARSVLNVTLGTGSNWRQVQITNAVGQVLLQQPALQGTRSIDLSKLPAGMYYLRLLGDGGTEVHAFVKE